MLKSTRFIFLLVLSTLFLFPFFWMLVSSLKPNEEVLALPVKIFPKIWEKSVIEIKTIPTNPKTEYK